MAGTQKIILVGNLGGDPEVKTISGDKKVAKFSLGVSESYKNKSGEKVTNTEWFDLEAWEGIAGIAERYLKKGSQIYVEGKQKTDKWETETGEKRSRKIVRITSLVMLGSMHKESEPVHEEDESDKLPF